ncbi:MAG: putative phage head [Marmoricola sp.]|nr:putative phage head [Marmoricola sp.]
MVGADTRANVSWPKRVAQPELNLPLGYGLLGPVLPNGVAGVPAVGVRGEPDDVGGHRHHRPELRAYVLNAEGSRSGVPVDSAARRPWGVPVTVTTAVAAGTGYMLSGGAVQLATDGQIGTEQSEATGDDFARNAVRLRCETRVDLAVLRPLGVVQLDVTAA